MGCTAEQGKWQTADLPASRMQESATAICFDVGDRDLHTYLCSLNERAGQ
jgi:hypothetical protein